MHGEENEDLREGRALTVDLMVGSRAPEQQRGGLDCSPETSGRGGGA